MFVCVRVCAATVVKHPLIAAVDVSSADHTEWDGEGMRMRYEVERCKRTRIKRDIFWGKDVYCKVKCRSKKES